MFTSDQIQRLAARGAEGKWAELARAVTAVENSPPWRVALPEPERPTHIIGVTGPPGAGKSTLTGRMIEAYADAGARVAVVAIDPSSPITGGALLGDRLRMETHLDGRPDVFVRSLASRGSHGAVAAATRNVARLLELSEAFDVIFIETVGAGQTEVAIVELADTVILVTVPGLGDAVQTIKAGFMEIANLFIVNMADRPGARETSRHLRLAVGRGGMVKETIATDGVGISEVRKFLEERWAELNDSDELGALRKSKWISDATLTAEAWVSACAKNYEPQSSEDLESAVHSILKEAVEQWKA